MSKDMNKDDIITKVICKISGNVTKLDIYPATYTNIDDPVESPKHAFKGYGTNNQLNNKLLASGMQNITIVCTGDFGGGALRPQAATALQGYNLTIIAKSIDQSFFNSCNDVLKEHLITNATVDELYHLINNGDVDVDDEIQIQTFVVIKRPGDPGSEDKQD